MKMADLTFAVAPEVIKALILALGVIVADALLGLVRAISRGEFDVRMLPRFLRTNVLPYAGGLLVLAVFSMFIEEIKAILLTSTGFVVAKFLAEILDKLRAMGMAKQEETNTTTE